MAKKDPGILQSAEPSSQGSTLKTCELHKWEVSLQLETEDKTVCECH